MAFVGSRAHRVSLHTLGVIGLVLTFVAAWIVGLALHADLAPGRRLAGRALQRLLGGALTGTVEVGRFESIGLGGAMVKDAVLRDTYGRKVIVLEGVRADLAVLVIAHDLLFSKPPLMFISPHVRAERAVVDFIADPQTSEPTIVRALTPRPSASGPSAGPSTAPSVYLPSIEIGTLKAHAELKGVPPLDADLRSVQGSLLVDQHGLSVDVKRFGLVLRGLAADARGTGTVIVRAPGPLAVTFQGYFGDVETNARVLLDAGKLDIVLDVPSATPQAMRKIVPEWPVEEPVSGHFEASGEVPQLRTKASLKAGNSTLDVNGPVVLGSEPSALLTVTARRFDARLVHPDAPRTTVDLDATVVARTVSGKLTTDVHAHTEPTLVEGTLVPALDLDGKWDGEHASGTLHLDEQGLPTTATFDVTKTGVADIDVRTADSELPSIVRLPLRSVKGRARGHARVRIENGKLRATYDVDLRGLSTPEATLDKARITGEASADTSALEKLRYTAKLEGNGAKAGTLTFGKVTASATGDGSGANLEALAAEEHGAEVRGKGRLVLGGKPSLSGTKLSLRRDPVLIEGEIDQLDFASGKIDVHNVRVTGAGGELTGAVRLAEGLVEFEAAGENVDLDALSRAFGLPRGTMGGTMRVNAEVAAGRDVTRGRVRVGLANGTFGDVGGLALQLSADLDDRTLTGGASGLLAGIATFGATWNVELAGAPFELDAYRNATGTSEVQIGNIRLALLSPLLPKDAPVSRIGGTAFARALLERRSAEAKLPNVFATISTQNLEVELRGDPPRVVQGIDVNLTGALDGATGESTGTTLLADAHGNLLTATGTVRLDVERFVADPLGAVSHLVETPIEAVITLPARHVEDLPELVSLPGVTGTVNGKATVKGTLAHPTLFASAQGTQLSSEDAGLGHPIDVRAEGQYEWDTRAAFARVTGLLKGTQVANVTVRGIVPESGLADLTADGRVEVSGLPIDLLGSLSRNAIAGSAYGSATFSKWARGGTAKGDFRVLQASVDKSPLGEGHLVFDATNPVARATIEFAGSRGTLDGELTMPLSFAHFLPSVPPTAPIRAKLEATDFSAAVLSPTVNGVLSRLGGRLDADLSLELIPVTSDTPVTWIGGARGKATLKEGAAFIEPLGVDVRNMSFDLAANGKGASTDIAVRGIRGRVRSATDNVEGTLDLTLDRFSLASGTAELHVNDMPILLQGAPQGRATGFATAKLKGEPGVMLVDVEVPDMAVDIPPSSTRAVVDLRPNPDIVVLQYEKDEVTTDKPTIWRLIVNLGKNVRLRRSDIDLAVTGTPTVELGGPETTMSGTVELTPGGRVPLLGKVFVIDEGRVDFDTGDPGNPRVDIRAVWRAPTDYQVIVQVTGTLRENQVALRSEPPLSQPEVFALLLGGSSADTNEYYTDPTRTNSGSAAGSVALGSGVSALGLNDLLSNNPVELRVETTSQSRPRYTAAVRLRQNLWFEASTYQQTELGAGAAASRNVYSGTVDYRFTEKWSLRTEVGTAGGAMDLLWQYRY